MAPAGQSVVNSRAQGRPETEYVSLSLGEDDAAEYENVHGVPLGGGLYQIDNSPFYAYGLSFRDIVRADHSQGRLLFKEVVERGGHSTYRVKLQPGNWHDDFLTRFKPLAALGSSFEGSSSGKRLLYAIDVPPNADIQKIYNLLAEGENDNFWEFEEVHFFPGHGT